MKENIILLKTVDFSVGIKKYCESLFSKKETAQMLQKHKMQKAELILSIK
jgi:hypothetical protein